MKIRLCQSQPRGKGYGTAMSRVVSIHVQVPGHSARTPDAGYHRTLVYRNAFPPYGFDETGENYPKAASRAPDMWNPAGFQILVVRMKTVVLLYGLIFSRFVKRPQLSKTYFHGISGKTIVKCVRIYAKTRRPLPTCGWQSFDCSAGATTRYRYSPIASSISLGV